jgi:hypothetical protein
VVGFECADVGLDSFLNVRKRGFLGFALGYTAGQTGTLGDHQAVFPSIEQDLSHSLIVSDSGEKSEGSVSKKQPVKAPSLPPESEGIQCSEPAKFLLVCQPIRSTGRDCTDADHLSGLNGIVCSATQGNDGEQILNSVGTGSND